MRRVLTLCAITGVLGVAVGMGLAQREDQIPSTTGTAYAVQPATDVALKETTGWADPKGTERPLTNEEQTNISVYEQANPSVVNIDTRSVEVDRFFGMQREAEGTGSGAILDRDGHIITNFHVIDGADQIQITMASNKSYPAVVVGGDKEQDIAVLKVDAPADELTPITLGSSDHLRVGQRVYVLGNPFGWDGTLSTGIVSSLNRDLPSRVPGRMMQALIQTDAAMNPGNSGGPLVDSRGRVVGINTAIIQPAQGICFSIPINMAKHILPALLKHGRVIRGYLGMHGRQIPIPLDVGRRVGIEMGSGVEVLALEPNGPADRAGLDVEDILVSFGEESIASVDDLHRLLTQHPVGKPVELQILRNGRRLSLDVVPGEFPVVQRE